ncbi:excalibur calcium-binding domain-containing protein [Facklamia sp. P12955]|uniref:excalibur calcium-binding domain-containing protein n=1 Tax=Facklamia sp. P12955 TaxID=3421946 RepID=UPI003D16C614
MKKWLLAATVGLLTSGLFFNTWVSAEVNEEELGYVVFAEREDQSNFEEVDKYKVLSANTMKASLKSDKDKVMTFNLLHILSPEEEKDEAYAQEAKERLEELMKDADKVELELFEVEKEDFQDESVKKEDYVANLWLDGILVQEILLTEGYSVIQLDKTKEAEMANEYLDVLVQSQDYAAKNRYYVWEDNSNQFLANAEFPEVIKNTQTGQVVVSQADNTQKANALFELPSKNNPSHPTQESNNSYINQTEEVSAPVVSKEPVDTNTEPEPAPEQNVYYANCTIARQAGAAPVYRGQPGYGPHLDRDNDGIGCE